MVSYKHGMSQFTYTGVGARNTPDRILDIMEHMGYALAQRGYVLRSGGAEGADKAFEAGCDAAQGSKKVYIPWSGFNNYIPNGVSIMTLDQGNRDGAIDIIKDVHPAFNRLSRGALALHARNVYQVTGIYLDSPSQFLLCYATVDNEGIPVGGTRTAWVVARMFDIPCFNLSNDRDYERITKFLKDQRAYTKISQIQRQAS